MSRPAAVAEYLRASRSRAELSSAEHARRRRAARRGLWRALLVDSARELIARQMRRAYRAARERGEAPGEARVSADTVAHVATLAILGLRA